MTARKNLTPAQDYLKRVYVALNSGNDAELLSIILERPGTLKNAVSALFYKQNGFDVKRYI